MIADIGGTNSRFGLVDDAGLPCGEALIGRAGEEPVELARTVIAQAGSGQSPSRGVIAVAAPVMGDQIRLANRGWSLSQSKLREQLGLRDGLRFVNDLVALAYALPVLGGSVRVAGGCPVGVLASGTGLGMAGLLPVGGNWQALASEGGQAAVAPADALERRVVDCLQERLGQVSVEQVASGCGLENIRQALAALESPGTKVPRICAAEVAHRARKGDRLSRKAVALLWAFLGTAAGNLALTLGARGGIYLSGGLVSHLADLFDQQLFRKRFIGSQLRVRDYLSGIQTHLIFHPLPSFLGLQAIVKYAPEFITGSSDELPLLRTAALARP